MPAGKALDRAHRAGGAVLGGQRAGYGVGRRERNRFGGGACSCDRERPGGAGGAASDKEIFALIFQPGFSTARQVTDVSGRGVGMDVVRQRVESLRGTIDVASTPGSGTSVTMRLPLTMAIIDGLLVTVGDGSFVLPMASTLECIELTRDDIERAHGKHLATVRGEIVPYVRLREYFHLAAEGPEIEQIMLVDTGEGRVGFVVDKVLGNCQTVIKSLGRLYRHVQMVSGATILGNGTVALILDPDRLIQEAMRADRAKGSGRVPTAGGSRPGMERERCLAAKQGRWRWRQRNGIGNLTRGVFRNSCAHQPPDFSRAAFVKRTGEIPAQGEISWELQLNTEAGGRTATPAIIAETLTARPQRCQRRETTWMPNSCRSCRRSCACWTRRRKAG